MASAAIVVIEVLPDGSGRRSEWSVSLEMAHTVKELLGDPAFFGAFSRRGVLDLSQRGTTDAEPEPTQVDGSS